ncbi:MAG TPA: malate dehydrogenase, partial [Nitrososphaeraceae archaeon]|nr:malate dehydrogenase [Nitrososphaeraceae archaeon]
GIDSRVKGSNSYEDMVNSDFVVLVAGLGRKPGMTRMDLLNKNANIVKDVSNKISKHANDATVIVVTNPLDPMTYLALKTTGFKKNKVFGMGGMLDLARFKSFIHDITGSSRKSIQAMVISEHGENMLPLIRFSSIGGIPLNEFLSNEQSQEIFERTKKAAAEVIALKGATVYAPGNAVATMIESMKKNKKQVIPVSAYLEGEYGISDLCIGVPVILGSNGIEKIIELQLNESERKIFDLGVKSVKEGIKFMQSEIK